MNGLNAALGDESTRLDSHGLIEFRSKRKIQLQHIRRLRVDLAFSGLQSLGYLNFEQEWSPSCGCVSPLDFGDGWRPKSPIHNDLTPRGARLRSSEHTAKSHPRAKTESRFPQKKSFCDENTDNVCAPVPLPLR